MGRGVLVFIVDVWNRGAYVGAGGLPRVKGAKATSLEERQAHGQYKDIGGRPSLSSP